jgi:5-(carboxyamino)imidazole ribonucleotide synthase
MANSQIIPPGSTIGMLGGGQLGRMTILAAAALGYKAHVFTDDPNSPAAQVASQVTIAKFDDKTALTNFAKSVQVVTFEFENIPAQAVEVLAPLVPTHPSAKALRIAQDRVAEKKFVNGLDLFTTKWVSVESLGQLQRALEAMDGPSILKSNRSGYDGKGQVKIAQGGDATAAWNKMGAPAGILEAIVDFELELSVVLARGRDGVCAIYPVVENRHVDHVLAETIAPARIPTEVAADAQRVAKKIADALEIVGVLAVEMFMLPGGKLLVNEIAPRPHNSGHWTIDACIHSQFEQFVRAVCGLPLGTTEHHSDAIMTNLLGQAAEGWRDYAAMENSKLHLYGKAEARPGRKMGHVTTLFPKWERQG